MTDLSIIDIEKKYIRSSGKEPTGKSAQSVVNKLLSIEDFINKNLSKYNIYSKNKINKNMGGSESKTKNAAKDSLKNKIQD